MNQLISNVLMQPIPDAVEHLTLIEKLELEKECWHDDGENNVHRVIDDCIDIVKQHQAESGWVSVNERLPERVKLCFILAKSDTRGLCYHLGVCIDDIWFDYLDRKIQDTAIFWQYANIPQPPSEVQDD